MQIGYSSRTLHRVPLLLAKNKKLRLHFKLAGEQAELGDASSKEPVKVLCRYVYLLS